MAEGIGAAVYIPQLESVSQFQLKVSCSIFSCQAVAICKALELILEIDNQSFVILSDSMSVLKALANSKPWSYKYNPNTLEYSKVITQISIT